MKAAYDLDGVLCEPPPMSPLPWRKMNGEQRAARRALLMDFYENASRLHNPQEQSFGVITARKLDVAARATRVWLERHFHGRVVQLAMLEGARTHERVVEYKFRRLVEWGVEDYAEDNRDVVRDLRKRVAAEGVRCRIWHYKTNQLVLDYEPGWL